MLAKKDGSSLYAARDVAAAEFRLETFSPIKIIYVVGNEQTLHFKQVFTTLVCWGMTRKSSGTTDSDWYPCRKENVYERRTRDILEDLIKEAIERAEKNCRREKLRTDRYGKKEIASAVGIGAIIYNDLSQSREKIFNSHGTEH